MAKPKTWKIIVDEIEYLVEFKRSIWSNNGHKLIINGQAFPIYMSGISAFTGTHEHPFKLGEKPVSLVIMGNNADLAIDGHYLGSKKPYLPLKKVPGWMWIFMVLLIAIPVITLGGIVPILLGFLGVTFCVRLGMNPFLQTSTKVINAILITVGAWVLFIAYLIFMLPYLMV